MQRVSYHTYRTRFLSPHHWVIIVTITILYCLVSYYTSFRFTLLKKANGPDASTRDVSGASQNSLHSAVRAMMSAILYIV